MNEIIFATTNEHKLKEAAVILEPRGFRVLSGKADVIEIQSEDPIEVCEDKARKAYAQIGRPLIVDDAGLFVPRLKGFPGTMTSQVADTIGIDGFIKLCDDNEPAQFSSVVCYYDGNRILTSVGKVDGFLKKDLVGNAGRFSDIFYVESENMILSDMSMQGLPTHRQKALTGLLDKI